MQDTRHLFPVLDRCIYLNHAAISPWPQPVVRAVEQFAQENLNQGAINYAAWMAREQRLRQRLADFIHADSADDIALLKNTSEGLSVVASGLAWQPGDNIVLPAGEFPSNNLPWQAQRAHGVEVREVNIRGADPENVLIEAMDSNTRVLTVSAVQYLDGLKLNLEHLGQACKANSTWFIVDAIQALGVHAVDVEAAQISALSADAHKWLLGPEGIAVFYIQPELREQLTLRQHGWRMLDHPFQFERDDWQPSLSARRFEAGSPNNLGITALAAALQMFEDLTQSAVAAAIDERILYLAEGLDKRPDLQIQTDLRAARRSGILSFSLYGQSTEALYRRLLAENIILAKRGDSLRVSPHFYIPFKQLEDFMNVVYDI